MNILLSVSFPTEWPVEGDIKVMPIFTSHHDLMIVGINLMSFQTDTILPIIDNLRETGIST